MAAAMSDMQNQLRALKVSNEKLNKLVPLANLQYLVLCAETAELVVDHLDKVLLAIVGKRLENVNAETKSALLSGPFATFKAKDHHSSSPKLCGSYADLVKAVEDGNAWEKFKDIVDKIEVEFLRENNQFTVPELRDQVAKFSNLNAKRNLVSHYISKDAKEIRAKLIAGFISNGGLETDPSLLACSPFINLGIRFLLEGPPQMKICSQAFHPLDIVHPVNKKTSQEVSIRVEELEFVPGHVLKIFGPVPWFGGGDIKKARVMERNPSRWKYKAKVGIPENELPYACEVIKYHEETSTYERGAQFMINPTFDEDKISLASWNEMNEPEYVIVEGERKS